MSWKLKTLRIENFKYFHAPFPLDIESKNLLVYGENGSGKSSIYWALYTLFQSRLKPDAASVEKYFLPASDENLRNKYSAIGDISKVEVWFEDKANPAAGTRHYTIAPGAIDTQNSADTFLEFTVTASDFLNYKILSKLTDKENSVINDVTDLFLKEIYPFADFDSDYEDLEGNHSGIRNARRWHDYINEALGQLKHQSGKRRAHFDKNDIKYTRFQKLIRDFRDQLKLYLDDVSQRATTKLRDEFGVKDVEIHLETDAEYAFDKQLPASPRYRDHTLHPLHIRLKASLVNAQLPGGSSEIIHLRTFFNEAKLTCIGLAIRLAVVDKKYIAGGNLAAVLCLDDMLVSLDMSYRVPVINALMKYANNYQLFIFTHDRSLYNMMRSTIKELGISMADWKLIEFYRSDPAKESTEEPKVNKIEPKEGIEQVKNYIAQGDYPAAGNYLRKYAEGLLKGILPLNMTFDITDEGDLKRLMLRGLFNKSRSTGQDGFCTLYGISKNDMPNISKHLDRLMNPLSHDNKDVPIFRQELEAAIVEVAKYEPILAAKKIIVKRQEAGTKRFKIEMTNGGMSYSVEFFTTEQWDYFDFAAPAGRKYKDCEVQIKAVNGVTIPLNCRMKVKNLYSEVRRQSHLSEAAAPAFDQAIIKVETGALLSTL